jgi:REP element-mobilizing transposase RayT
MAIARSKLVDVSVARWYHCVSRCVRKAFLLGEGDGNRKQWLEKRLEELGEIFALSLGGFSLMDNHLHVLLRLDPAVARTTRAFPSRAGYCQCRRRSRKQWRERKCASPGNMAS